MGSQDEKWIRIQGMSRRGHFGDYQATYHARAAASAAQGDHAGHQANLVTADRMTGGTGPDGKPIRAQGIPAAEA